MHQASQFTLRKQTRPPYVTTGTQSEERKFGPAYVKPDRTVNAAGRRDTSALVDCLFARWKRVQRRIVSRSAVQIVSPLLCRISQTIIRGSSLRSGPRLERYHPHFPRSPVGRRGFEELHGNGCEDVSPSPGSRLELQITSYHKSTCCKDCTQRKCWHPP